MISNLTILKITLHHYVGTNGLTILAWMVLIILGIRIFVALVNLWTRPWLWGRKPQCNSLVSVLIPARNEEKVIGQLLSDLRLQEYHDLEILVYDDLSTDGTSDVVLDMAKSDQRISLHKGTDLPADWLGKNHACFKLAQQAKGDFFLFLDADVRLRPEAIGRALSHMNTYRLKLFSLFPSQQMDSLGEKISVPLMNWVLLSLLPLILTRRSSYSSLSAANGQFMFFEAKTYKDLQPHRQFRKHAVEDIAIARYFKTRRQRIQTLLGGHQVSCRMYGSLHEAITGFSKNVLAFFGNSITISFLFALITSFGILAVYAGLPQIYLLIYIAGVLLLRAIIAVCGKQPVFFQIVTSPLQQIIFIWVVIQAITRRIKKTNTWKGRSIDI